jgi:hypothetical protein
MFLFELKECEENDLHLVLASGVDPKELRKPLRPLARELVRKRGKR